jgi:hypothetical protein
VHESQAMALSATGGPICWRCQLSSEIAAHERNVHAAARRRHPLIVTLGLASLATCILIGMIALGLIAIVFGHPC